MRPILFEVLGMPIYGYGLMIAIGIIAAALLLNYRAKKRNYNEDHIFNMLIVAVVAGIIGGKLLYLIVEYKEVLADPIGAIKNIGQGFVVYGAIFGGFLAVVLYCKKRKWNALAVVDLAIPSVALGQAFGRIGCFLAGCCYGAETSCFLGVEFAASSMAPSGVHLHPTQLYSSLFNFLLAFFLLWYDKRKKNEGATFSMYLIVYSIGRFLVEFLRADPRGNVGFLSTSQFIAIFTFIIGIGFYFYIKNKGRVINSEEK